MRAKLLVVVLHDLLHVVLVADGLFLIFRHRVGDELENLANGA